MKKLILFVVVIELFLSQINNAQILNSYGLKIAYTSANQRYDYTNIGNIGTKRRIGFNAAIFAEWFNLPFVSLVTQCEYAQRGVGIVSERTLASSPDIVETNTYYSRVDYLSIPVFAKITVPVGPINPYVLIGPRIDFLLGYNSAFNDIYDHFSKTMTGASCGFGVNLKTLLPVTVLVEARYNADFKDSFSNQNLTVRNNSWDIWLGVAF
jgi:Outer membrane protein beta-barrel domain